MKRIAILVTGSRDRKDREPIYNALSGFRSGEGEHVVVIHGDAAGADEIAGTIARRFGFNVIAMPAQWRVFGKKAGPMRNAAMVNLLATLEFHGYDCIVLAFPLEGSVGTYDCMRQAESAGFKVTNLGKRLGWE